MTTLRGNPHASRNDNGGQPTLGLRLLGLARLRLGFKVRVARTAQEIAALRSAPVAPRAGSALLGGSLRSHSATGWPVGD